MIGRVGDRWGCVGDFGHFELRPPPGWVRACWHRGGVEGGVSGEAGNSIW